MTAWMVFTTLFDASFGVARPALQRLVSAGISVVPITSNTFAEMRPLADALGISGPVIFESGGGIARRVGSSWRVEACGSDTRTLRAAVPLIEQRAKARLRLYSGMRLDEAAAASGLTGIELRRSMQRHFDEPFLLESGSLADVESAAASLGLRVQSGRRFHHLYGTVDTGSAAKRIRDEIAAALRTETLVVALGDAPIDAEFLSIADIPIIVPRADGTPDPVLIALVPDARIASRSGPRGWAGAIDEISLALCSAGGAAMTPAEEHDRTARH
jgi:mannosyl-3-phosphoglycerate phosphatase